MRRWLLGILFFLLCATSARADLWHQCVQAKITGVGDPVRMDVSHYSVPWTAWIGPRVGALGAIYVSGFGPCRTNDPPLTCPRVGSISFGQIEMNGVEMIRGVGPIEAVEFSQGTCTNAGCIGGPNAEADCTVDSECPGSACGCEQFVAFCGGSSGVGN